MKPRAPHTGILERPRRQHIPPLRLANSHFGNHCLGLMTTENMLQNPERSKSTRLRLATFAVAHAFDHYGQMVEYLRMNGIVPPASRAKSD